PAHGDQLRLLSEVALGVGVDFRFPEVRSCSGQSEEMAVMAMPEAAMHEHDRTVPGQDDVRAPGKSGAPEAVSEAQRVEAMADLQFDLCVLSLDPGHQRGALLRADDVRQRQATFRSALLSAIASKRGTISSATAPITGTTTELPNCL